MKGHGQKCIQFLKKALRDLTKACLRRSVVSAAVVAAIFYFPIGVSAVWSLLGGLLFYVAVLAAESREEMVIEAMFKARADERRLELDQLLETMMDEPAVQRAKDAYAALKRSADDPWDDTGWDEPWSAAIEAAFLYAIKEKEE